jgi:hypothetical protein
MIEYLITGWAATQQRYQTRPLVAETGTFTMTEEAGLGPSLDEARIERL